uniref:Ig-like domain-containing protein n=1 Tax=Salmo trutta TaxID=8032 RepID=A0A674F582_SALTR
LLLYVVKIYLSIFSGCRAEEKVTQPTEDIMVFGLEGDVINLSCNYSSASTLQWYQQYPGSPPIFLLLTGVSSNPSVVKAKPEDPRLSVKLNDERTRVELEISSAVVTDSALYYCALEPTVTGNPETLYKNLTAHDKHLLCIF